MTMPREPLSERLKCGAGSARSSLVDVMGFPGRRLHGFEAAAQVADRYDWLLFDAGPDADPLAIAGALVRMPGDGDRYFVIVVSAGQG